MDNVATVSEGKINCYARFTSFAHPRLASHAEFFRVPADIFEPIPQLGVCSQTRKNYVLLLENKWRHCGHFYSIGTCEFNAGGNPEIDWHFVQGGGEILLVASCYRN